MKIKLSELETLVLNAEPNSFLRKKIGEALFATLSQGIRDGVFPDTDYKFGEFGAFTNPATSYLSSAISWYAELVNEDLEVDLNF